MEVEGGGEGDGEAGGDALDGTADGCALVAGDLLFGRELCTGRAAVSTPDPRRRGWPGMCKRTFMRIISLGAGGDSSLRLVYSGYLKSEAKPRDWWRPSSGGGKLKQEACGRLYRRCFESRDLGSRAAPGTARGRRGEPGGPYWWEDGEIRMRGDSQGSALVSRPQAVRTCRLLVDAWPLHELPRSLRLRMPIGPRKLVLRGVFHIRYCHHSAGARGGHMHASTDLRAAPEHEACL